MKKIFLFAFAALALGFTACVEDKPYVGISSVTQSPAAVTPDDVVEITAVTVNVSSANLIYTINSGAEQTVEMTGNNNTFKGSIPKQVDGTKVTYWVVAGIAKSEPKEFTVSAEVFDYSNLVLNEVDGVNKSVELYNKGSQTLPLTGCKLVKNNEAASAWWIGDGASGNIAPSGFVVIIQDNTIPGLKGNGGISPKKSVKFELFDPQGNSLGVFLRGAEATIDSSISDVSPNSFQRIPNGTGDWKMAAPTNGATNATTGQNIPQE